MTWTYKGEEVVEIPDGMMAFVYRGHTFRWHPTLTLSSAKRIKNLMVVEQVTYYDDRVVIRYEKGDEK